MELIPAESPNLEQPHPALNPRLTEANPLSLTGCCRIPAGKCPIPTPGATATASAREFGSPKLC